VGSLDEVATIRIPRSALVETERFLRRCGEDGNEGMVLWVGKLLPSVAAVEVVLVPSQNPIQSEDGVGYFVRSETLREINLHLLQTRRRLIAQVHSHPGEAYHSEADDRYAIMTTEGGLSVVVPEFAREPMRLSDCAIYRLTRSEWRSLSTAEIERLFVITA
jgi:proteasome lid subunit RPN8/RPN11